MNRINPILIILQWFGILFLINGVLRLYYSYYSVEILFLNIAEESSNSPEILSILDTLLNSQAFFSLGTYFIGIISIALINWKKKIHYINTILVSIFLFIIFPTGLLFKGKINTFFNYFDGLFSNDDAYSYFIAGIIFILVGSILILLSKNLKNNTVHNNG